MRKTILYCLLAWTASVPALALTVPDGQAAVVEAVIGKARADQGHGFKAMKLGEALSPGSTIKTGANGRVALTLPDGSTARIASNTELTLKDETVRKGIFTRLVLGTVRFLVMKQDKDNSFETEMPNAVAGGQRHGPRVPYGRNGQHGGGIFQRQSGGLGDDRRRRPQPGPQGRREAEL